MRVSLNSFTSALTAVNSRSHRMLGSRTRLGLSHSCSPIATPVLARLLHRAEDDEGLAEKIHTLCSDKEAVDNLAHASRLSTCY